MHLNKCSQNLNVSNDVELSSTVLAHYMGLNFLIQNVGTLQYINVHKMTKVRSFGIKGRASLLKYVCYTVLPRIEIHMTLSSNSITASLSGTL